MIQTFEVRVSIYEPEPQTLTYYHDAHSVTGAIAAALSEINRTTDLPQRACTVLAQPCEITIKDYANPHHPEGVPAHQA